MVVANTPDAFDSSDVRRGSGRAARRWPWIVAILVALTTAGVAVWRLTPREVPTVTLTEREIVRTLAVVGQVRAPSRAGLGASVAGTVREVRVREGHQVSAGDTLVVLDDREAVAGLREAEAALAETGATVQQSIEEAERDALQAQRDFERIRSVFETGGLTRQRLEPLH